MEEKSENNVSVTQIAKIAGVSPTTVQNVLHNRQNRMREETFFKVKRVIAETGYVQMVAPNLLSGKASKVIGAIVSEEKMEGEIKKLYSEILFGLEKELYKNDFYLILHVADKIEEIVHFIRAWRLQGVFLLGMEKEEKQKIIGESKIPIMSYESDKMVKKQIKDFVNIVKNNV